MALEMKDRDVAVSEGDRDSDSGRTLVAVSLRRATSAVTSLCGTSQTTEILYIPKTVVL